MKNIVIFFSALVVIVLAVVAFVTSMAKPLTVAKLTPVTVAMDYTPNTNHTGIYVALSKGWYKQQGLDVKLLPYSPSVSADLLVAQQKADVGISYTEGVVSDAASGTPVVSIATIIQHNTSSLVALANNGITRPKDLSGKIYGGFGAPYENAVVSEIIKKDGGKGDFKNITLDVDGLQALQTKKIDFAWIFDGWTGVQAKQEGINLVSFPVNSNGIPDYYTPVIITSNKEIVQKRDVLEKFIAATSKGYAYAISHPKEAAEILFASAPKGTFQDKPFILASQEYLSSHYVDAGRKWGLQDKEAWHGYPQFMLDSKSILDANGKPVTQMDFDSLYTNEFLQK